MLRSDNHLIAPNLVITEITNAAWKFVVFEVVKAFDEMVPTSVLKARALAIAMELRHPAYDCLYLALAEQNASPLVTADDRLIRRCADTPFEKLVQSL
jgi:predicted nucleic acid-binding protein